MTDGHSVEVETFIKEELFLFSRAVLQLCSLNGFFGEISQFLQVEMRFGGMKQSDWLRDEVT